MSETLTRERTCADYGHADNRHHRHCYHCGRTTGNHHSWCPDSAANRTRIVELADDEADRIAGLVGVWYHAVGCREVDIAYSSTGPGCKLDEPALD